MDKYKDCGAGEEETLSQCIYTVLWFSGGGGWREGCMMLVTHLHPPIHSSPSPSTHTPPPPYPPLPLPIHPTAPPLQDKAFAEQVDVCGGGDTTPVTYDQVGVASLLGGGGPSISIVQQSVHII